jgi:tRNA-dihydrouridine synthase A
MTMRDPSPDILAAPRRFCVAPMMDWTDRHCRYFLRLLSRRARLYTEMIPCGAILHGDRARVLRFHPDERPLALQLGGSEPDELADCARIAADFGYDEINLNVGCPSGRVQTGRFGACLMAEPARVAEGVAAMAAANLPVTVKTRTGIDDRDSEAFLHDFVATVAAAGCRTFIVHARKAWLRGLSPKENREVPPLDYAKVYRLKQAFPHLEIIVNGGITDLDQAESHLAHADGVMLGRAAYHNPYLLAEVDRRFYGVPQPPPRREEVIAQLVPYLERELAAGTRPHHITRHILGLYQGVPGARAWRRRLSEGGHGGGASIEPLRNAIQHAAPRGTESADYTLTASKSRA